MTTTPRPARWPALMDRATACEYLGWGLDYFDRQTAEGGVIPAPTYWKGRSPQWSRRQLDRMLDALDGIDAEPSDAAFDPFSAALHDGENAAAGPQ